MASVALLLTPIAVANPTPVRSSPRTPVLPRPVSVSVLLNQFDHNGFGGTLVEV
jgi:hypothetical protein